MNLKWSWTRIKYFFAVAVVIGTAGAVANFVGCGTSSGTVSYATTDPWVYTAYYPADVAYSSVYWTSDWAYAGLYATYPTAVVSNSDGGTTTTVVTKDAGTTTTTDAGTTTTTDAGTTTGGVLTTAGDAIRALARGESVCPGQITVTPKTAPPPCTGWPKTSTRAGVTIVFNGCQTAGGATLNGMVDVTSTKTASSATCQSATSITLSHTTTITNLSYTNASGGHLMIPSQTGSGQTTYTFGETPASVALSFKGQLQITNAGSSTVTSDHNYNGNLTFSFGGSSTSYNVNGGLTATDNLSAGVGATLTITGLERVTSCCRPVGGSINIVQTSSTGPGNHLVTFGPSCGEAMLDGTTATLPACL
jgi:hypothetical protein